MPRSRKLAALAVMVALTSASSGCTLVKPVVGAFTGSVYAAVSLPPYGWHRCDDGYAVGFYFAVAAIVGAGAGLVTGVISDIQALTGQAPDPCRNWYQPFATNTMGS